MALPQTPLEELIAFYTLLERLGWRMFASNLNFLATPLWRIYIALKVLFLTKNVTKSLAAGFRPWSSWGSLQCSPDPLAVRGKEKGESRGWRGGERSLRFCPLYLNSLATPLSGLVGDLIFSTLYCGPQFIKPSADWTLLITHFIFHNSNTVS